MSETATGLRAVQTSLPGAPVPLGLKTLVKKSNVYVHKIKDFRLAADNSNKSKIISTYYP
jgi:hypothetical protein